MSADEEAWQGKSLLIIFLTGVCFCILGVALNDTLFTLNTLSYLLISVGGSLVASAAVPFLLYRFGRRFLKLYDLHMKFGINVIYLTRAEMNIESNEDIINCKECIDICAMGLTGFRNRLKDEISEKVRKGVKIRILSPSPDKSPYLAQRDVEEENTSGQIKQNITDLCLWVKELKQHAPDSANVEIKVYSTLLLSSYMRVDEKIFVGPYMYKKLSQQTISASFTAGKVFDYYTGYFEALWSDTNFCSPPDINF